MEEKNGSEARKGNGLVADECARRTHDELQHKPLDRQLLDKLIARVGQGRWVCDIGTGSGHVARYLHDHGVSVCGVDLSAEMVARAQQLNPHIPFRQGNVFALEIRDNALAAITGFHALANIPRNDIVQALYELRRVLEPGGLLLLAFDIGEPSLHREEWWGAEVSRYFYFFRADEMSGYLQTARFEIEEIIERDPYREVEKQNRRAYLVARKPAAA